MRLTRPGLKARTADLLGPPVVLGRGGARCPLPFPPVIAPVSSEREHDTTGASDGRCGHGDAHGLTLRVGTGEHPGHDWSPRRCPGGGVGRDRTRALHVHAAGRCRGRRPAGRPARPRPAPGPARAALGPAQPQPPVGGGRPEGPRRGRPRPRSHQRGRRPGRGLAAGGGRAAGHRPRGLCRPEPQARLRPDDGLGPGGPAGPERRPRHQLHRHRRRPVGHRPGRGPTGAAAQPGGRLRRRAG